MKNDRFENLNLKAPFLKALSEEGYTIPTPIQNETIPLALQGSDILGMAQTGTGKTAAFTIPILQRISTSNHKQKKKGRRQLKALIISPTRELALQSRPSFRRWSCRRTHKQGDAGR